MSRRSRAEKRDLAPDARYNDVLMTRFINCIMHAGKKSAAERIVYSAMESIQEKLPNEEAIAVFQQAIENVRPLLEVRSRRVGGSNYQIPIEVRPERRTALSLRWLIESARARNERTMAERIGNELMDAFNKQGGAFRKREDVHRMAEANKAFAHYRW